MAFDSEASENYTDSEKQTQQQVSAFIEQIKILYLKLNRLWF